MKRPFCADHFPVAVLRSWLRASLVGLGPCLATAVALAQTLPPPPAESPEPPAPYIDRVMDAGSLPGDGLELKASEYTASGWPRSVHVDSSVFSNRGASDTQSRAVGVGGFIDTPNYGAWSINANLTQQQVDAAINPSRDRASWRIDQRGLPLDGGWRANHSAGDISTASSSLARGLGRVWLPTTPIRGLGGQWHLGDAVELNAAAGRTGLFNGLDLAGFEPTGGRVTSVGGQFQSRGGRTGAALQLIDGQGISDSTGIGATQNSRAFWTAAAWQGATPWGAGLAPGSAPPSERPGGLRLQGNLVRSSVAREGGAMGVWADAAWRTERWRNTAGLFRFEPNLRWGTAVLASDLQGAYWQAETRTRQWQAGFATELSDRVSDATHGHGAASRSAFLNLNGHYRLDTRSSLGAVLSLRTITSPGQALMLAWDRRTEWGQTQWRSDFANAGGKHTTRIGIDQSWPVISPASFNTSLAWERIAGDAKPINGWIWALLGTVSPLSQWSLDAALRGARHSNGAQALNANIGVAWQPFFSGWSLGLRYTQARGQEPLSTQVVSALTAATLSSIAPTQTNRSLQLLLRYEVRAGTASAPLGGLPGSGAGTLRGTVFFDNDFNGRREASEAGVPAVTVVLDGRFVTLTDAYGHYEFPTVAAGEHIIDISPDNVPLPWSPALRDPISTTLHVRRPTTVNFAVQRNR